MAYLGTQPNDVKKNTGLYTPSEILQLTKDGSWGGSLELIQEVTVSGSSTVNFTNLANTPYDVYFVPISNLHSSSASQNTLRFSNDNGSSFHASNYEYAFERGTTAGSFFDGRSTSATQINTEMLSDTSTGSSGNGYFYLYNLLDSNRYSLATFQMISSWSDERFTFGGGIYPVAEINNAFQIVASGGTLTGTIKLYGVKKL